MHRPLVFAALMLSGAAIAAEPLPLAHGGYVATGTPCADAPFAAMRSYDGIGLGDPHSHACRLRVLGRQGHRYTVANSCIGVGVGPGVRTTETLVVTIRSPRAFAVGGSPYRLCPRRG